MTTDPRPTSAPAEGSRLRTPGRLRTLDLGGVLVSFVPDGVGRLIPGVFLPSIDWTQRPDHLDEDGLVVASLGGFLVRTGSTTALIDTGYGPGAPATGPSMTGRGLGTFAGGRLLRNLRSLGIDRDAVDLVALTHLHFDHVGWLIGADGIPVFPKARYATSDREWTTAQAAGDPHGHLTTERFFRPLSAVMETFDGCAGLCRAVEALPTPGHTAGHTAYVVRGTERRVVVLGDAAHSPLELEHPEHGCRRDVDPRAAERSRRLLAALCREPDVVLAGGHFADAVFGRIETHEDAGPRWHSVDS